MENEKKPTFLKENVDDAVWLTFFFLHGCVASHVASNNNNI